MRSAFKHHYHWTLPNELLGDKDYGLVSFRRKLTEDKYRRIGGLLRDYSDDFVPHDIQTPIESRTSIGGLLPGIFPTCSWDIFGHESRLDQSDASKNI